MASQGMSASQRQIEALAAFRHALRRFLAFSEEATGAAGITAQQYQALIAIKARPRGAMRLGQLADEMLLKKHGAVQLVDRMEAAKLVERRAAKADARVVNVLLTEKGERIVQTLAALHLDQLARRKKQFADILRQMKRVSTA
jgi:DNA-binding MarR family transcriptional regulator